MCLYSDTHFGGFNVRDLSSWRSSSNLCISLHVLLSLSGFRHLYITFPNFVFIGGCGALCESQASALVDGSVDAFEGTSMVSQWSVSASVHCITSDCSTMLLSCSVVVSNSSMVVVSTCMSTP